MHAKRRITICRANCTIARPTSCLCRVIPGKRQLFHPGGYAIWPELRWCQRPKGSTAAAKAKALGCIGIGHLTDWLFWMTNHISQRRDGHNWIDGETTPADASRQRLNILGVEQYFTVAFVIRITEWLKLCLIYVPGTLLSMCLRVCSNSGMECHFYLVQVVPVLGSAILILWSMFQDTQVRFERRFMLKRFTVNTPEYYVWAIPKYYCFRLANSDDNAGLPGALDPWIGWVSSREYLLVLFE